MRRRLFFTLALCLAAAPAAAARIKDISVLRSAHDSQLVGYGLVVGLQGSGDTLRNAPFTEQSIEVDIDWPKDDPNADRLTKGTGWLEIMGAGMVHPVVLRNGRYNPDKFTGFAFGMGPQRITMLKYAIDDIRQFWGNDLRFLQQF